MIFSLVGLLGPKAPPIDIVDVGAMWLGEEGLLYKALVDSGAARVVGFEPIAAECNKLNAMNRKNQRYLPYFVGDGKEGLFRLCSHPMTSSLYEPNIPLLSKFNLLVDLTTPVQRIPCQTKRLDDIPEITGIDLLKIDVQGAELAVIKGGERQLKNAVCVITEVEFLEMYIGQPLFADVDAELRRQGFVLHTMGKPAGPAFKPISPDGDPAKGVNQSLWTDACYVKDFMRFGELSAEQLLKLAIIMHEVFISCDLAALAIQHYDAKTGGNLWERYMKTLCGGALPVKPPLT